MRGGRGACGISGVEEVVRGCMGCEGDHSELEKLDGGGGGLDDGFAGRTSWMKHITSSRYWPYRYWEILKVFRDKKSPSLDAS